MQLLPVLLRPRRVERRGDLKRVRVVYGDYRPSGNGDCHIYVAGENHPSIA